MCILKVSRASYIISTLVFGLAPAVGITVGLILTREEGVSIDDFALQVLQGGIKSTES